MSRWIRAWLPAGLWALLIFVLSAIPGPSLPDIEAPFGADKIVHVLVYLVLGALCFVGLRRTSQLRGTRAVLLAAALATGYGVIDEVHQLFTPGRNADWRDGVADAAGGLLGGLAMCAASRARRSDG